MASPNFQPSTFAHHARVAGGFALASSVWVMTPGRSLRSGILREDAVTRLRRGAADRFFATVFVLRFVELRFAIGFSSFLERHSSMRPAASAILFERHPSRSARVGAVTHANLARAAWLAARAPKPERDSTSDLFVT